MVKKLVFILTHMNHEGTTTSHLENNLIVIQDVRSMREDKQSCLSAHRGIPYPMTHGHRQEGGSAPLLLVGRTKWGGEMHHIRLCLIL